MLEGSCQWNFSAPELNGDVGFFKRSAPASSPRPATPPMGSGRRLRSSRPVAECLANIEALVDSYRPRKYEHLPAYDPAGFRWHGDGPAPDTAVSFDDVNEDVMLVTLRASGPSTEIGLFPLGAGDDRLTSLPVTGGWKLRDPSLASVGLIPAGQLTLRAPRIPDGFVADGLTLARVPVNPHNIDVFGRKLAELVLLKALQFIGSQDERQAGRFADLHRYSGGSIEAYLQSVVVDLVAQYPGMLPYVQGIASRARAILLDSLAERPDSLPLSTR